MIHELRTYTLVPGKMPEYLRLSGEIGRKARGNDYGRLEGYWFTEFGTLNQVVHLWGYPDLVERDRLRGLLAKNDGWTKGYLPRIRPLQVAQENKVLSPILPLRPPADAGWVYELRTYRLQPGAVGEWTAHVREIMPTREKYSKNIGYWQTEMGQLNEVVHLWAYRDLNERATVRAAVMQDPAWQAYLGKTAPMTVEQRSVILNPAPFSPMR